MNTRLQLAFTKRETSFFSDPEALGCLLHEILELCTGTDEPISLESVHASAVGLGYRGHATPIRRMLVAKGFLTDAKKGKSFYLHEGNRVAIDNFFSMHENTFKNVCLNASEQRSLFYTLGKKGSRVESLFVRVMRSISALHQELAPLHAIEQELISDLSEGEATQFLVTEHLDWCCGQFENICHEVNGAFKTSGHDPEKFHAVVLRYTAMFKRLTQETDVATSATARMKQLHRDRERVDLLKSLHASLRFFSTSFLDMEDAVS